MESFGHVEILQFQAVYDEGEKTETADLSYRIGRSQFSSAFLNSLINFPESAPSIVL